MTILDLVDVKMALAMSFTPVVSTASQVFLEAIAVEPRFAAVYVAYVEETFVGWILVAAISGDDKNVVPG